MPHSAVPGRLKRRVRADGEHATVGDPGSCVWGPRAMREGETQHRGLACGAEIGMPFPATTTTSNYPLYRPVAAIRDADLHPLLKASDDGCESITRQRLIRTTLAKAIVRLARVIRDCAIYEVISESANVARLTPVLHSVTVPRGWDNYLSDEIERMPTRFRGLPSKPLVSSR